MHVKTYDSDAELAKAAADKAASELTRAIAKRGRATFVAATGNSQLGFLEALTRDPDVDWSRTTMYHLDEYIGLPESHPASFRRYLRERLVGVVSPGTVNLIDGNAPDPQAECSRLSLLVERDGIDVAFVGIGENAHLGFNDPPAEFDNDASFAVVDLSDTCRAQQVHEGWFATAADVPSRAITMTVSGILRSQCIVCVVPEARKAPAVKCAVTGPITPSCPASALRKHPNAHLFLDAHSASLLDNATIGEGADSR
jgi:glucosamine-6-phosphate deaminase